jgi:hypothetical protein
MCHNFGLIGVSLLTLASANSPALGAVDEDVNTPDRVNSVCILFLENQFARPDSPALRITSSVIDHIDDRLRYRNKTAVAGMAPSREIKHVAPRAGWCSRHRPWATNTERRIADFKTRQEMQAE